MTIRVLLVDDHKVVRMGLRAALGQDPTIEIVGEAENGAEGIAMARKLLPDVVLMDIQLPLINGVEATKQIVHELPGVKVIMLTMYNEANHELAALRVGALGYMHKDSDPSELLEAIHTVADGAAFLTPQSTHRMLGKLQSGGDQDKMQASANGDSLTEREIDLLRYLAKGLSSKEIARELSLSDPRVRTLLSDLYAKLRVNGRAQAAAYAVERHLF